MPYPSYEAFRNRLFDERWASPESLPAPTPCYLLSLNCGDVYFWPGNLKRILDIAKEMNLTPGDTYYCSQSSLEAFAEKRERILLFLASHEIAERTKAHTLGSFRRA